MMLPMYSVRHCLYSVGNKVTTTTTWVNYYYYLSQCWPRSMSPYGITRLQWVNGIYHRNIGLCKQYSNKYIYIYIPLPIFASIKYKNLSQLCKMTFQKQVLPFSGNSLTLYVFFFTGNIPVKLYWWLISFLHTDTMQVVQILKNLLIIYIANIMDADVLAMQEAGASATRIFVF